MKKNWTYNDGGRKAAGFKGDTGDCAVRAIAIATELPYKEVYDIINMYGSKERRTEKVRDSGHSSARSGVWKETFKKVMMDLGWDWVPCMTIGSGCKVHLRASELPMGRIICNVSKHYVAMIDGVVQDTEDPTRGGMRCVYGYWERK